MIVATDGSAWFTRLQGNPVTVPDQMGWISGCPVAANQAG